MSADLDPRNAMGPWTVEPRCPWIPTDDRIVLMKCADKEKIGPGGIIDPTQRDLSRFVIVGMGVNAAVSTLPGGEPSGIGLGDVIMIPGDHVVTIPHKSRPYFIVPGSSVMMIQAKGGTTEAEDWPIMARYTLEDDEPAPRGRVLVPAAMAAGKSSLVGPDGKPIN